MAQSDNIIHNISKAIDAISKPVNKSNSNSNNNNPPESPPISITSINILNVSIEAQVVLYEIRIETNYKIYVNNKDRNLIWHITRRFQEFHDLHHYLTLAETEYELSPPANLNKNSRAITLPPFPSRALWFFQNHFEPNFLEQRLIVLENYLQKLSNNSLYKRNKTFLQFLTPNHEETLATGKLTQKENNDDTTNNSNNNTINETESQEEAKFLNSEETKSEKSQSSTNTNVNTFSLSRFPSASSEVTFVSIPTAQILRNKHVVFHLSVENSAAIAEYSKWTTLKRYSEFVTLDQAIRNELTAPNISRNSLNQTITSDNSRALSRMPLLPPKQFRFLVDHLQAKFIEERRLLLELYLRKLLADPVFCEFKLLLKFLGCNM